MSVSTRRPPHSAALTETHRLGIDIGGSKTHLLLTRGTSTVADLRGPSTNPASVGWAVAKDRLRALLAEVSAHAVAAHDIDSVCAGAAGVDSPEQAARITAILAESLPSARIEVVHDTALLLAAAGVDAGIALIAGTGSVAWGRTTDGREARAGGWGYVLGDDGSGYGIARSAVRHALGRLDSGLRPDRLSVQLTSACGLDRPGLLLDHFYARSERRYWAERSRVVFELADSRDPAALDLVTAAVRALAELVERVSLRLAIAGPVVLAGGVLVHQPLLRQLLGARLATIGITDLRLLQVDPVLGAVRLATARTASVA